METQFSVLSADAIRGLAYRLMGELDTAEKCYKRALGRLKAEIVKRPEDPRLHIALGFVQAGLGNKEEALRHADEAVRLMPMSKDAMVAPVIESDQTFILVLVGELERAIDHLEHLLRIPSWISRHVLRLDPRFDPLRDHPRFQQLVQGEDVPL
jgi:serine/threonine-protein kinase